VKIVVNKAYKFKIECANDTIASEQLSLRLSGKNKKGKPINAYRLQSIKIQIDDFDALADADYFRIQLSTKDLAGGSFETIDENHELLTLGEEVEIVSTGTDAGTLEEKTNVFNKLRNEGLLYRDGVDFDDVYIIKNQAWLNCKVHGQDANEYMHIKMKGKYVSLSPSDIEDLDKGVTLL
jgi:hypothetical protein